GGPLSRASAPRGERSPPPPARRRSPPPPAGRLGGEKQSFFSGVGGWQKTKETAAAPPPPLWGGGGGGGERKHESFCHPLPNPPPQAGEGSAPRSRHMRRSTALCDDLTSPVAASSARPCPRRDRSARARSCRGWCR